MKHIWVSQDDVGTLSSFSSLSKASVSVTCHRPHGQMSFTLVVVVAADYGLQHSQLILG